MSSWLTAIAKGAAYLYGGGGGGDAEDKDDVNQNRNTETEQQEHKEDDNLDSKPVVNAQQYDPRSVYASAKGDLYKFNPKREEFKVLVNHVEALIIEHDSDDFVSSFQIIRKNGQLLFRETVCNELQIQYNKSNHSMVFAMYNEAKDRLEILSFIFDEEAAEEAFKMAVAIKLYETNRQESFDKLLKTKQVHKELGHRNRYKRNLNKLRSRRAQYPREVDAPQPGPGPGGATSGAAPVGGRVEADPAPPPQQQPRQQQTQSAVSVGLRHTNSLHQLEHYKDYYNKQLNKMMESANTDAKFGTYVEYYRQKLKVVERRQKELKGIRQSPPTHPTPPQPQPWHQGGPPTSSPPMAMPMYDESSRAQQQQPPPPTNGTHHNIPPHAQPPPYYAGYPQQQSPREYHHSHIFHSSAPSTHSPPVSSQHYPPGPPPPPAHISHHPASRSPYMDYSPTQQQQHANRYGSPPHAPMSSPPNNNKAQQQQQAAYPPHPHAMYHHYPHQSSPPNPNGNNPTVTSHGYTTYNTSSPPNPAHSHYAAQQNPHRAPPGNRSPPNPHYYDVPQ